MAHCTFAPASGLPFLTTEDERLPFAHEPVGRHREGEAVEPEHQRGHAVDRDARRPAARPQIVGAWRSDAERDRIDCEGVRRSGQREERRGGEWYEGTGPEGDDAGQPEPGG